MLEIKTYWSNLQDKYSIYAEARKAKIMMLAPPDCISSMCWEDLDLVNAVWTIRRSGAAIPLPMPMVEMLTKRQNLADVSPYVFFDELVGDHIPAETLRFGELMIYEAFVGWFVKCGIEKTIVSEEFIHQWAAYLMEAEQQEAHTITAAVGRKSGDRA